MRKYCLVDHLLYRYLICGYTQIYKAPSSPQFDVNQLLTVADFKHPHDTLVRNIILYFNDSVPSSLAAGLSTAILMNGYIRLRLLLPIVRRIIIIIIIIMREPKQLANNASRFWDRTLSPNSSK